MTRAKTRSLLPENKTLCAYLRLTVDRDGKKIGYEVQRRHIQRWADAFGYTIGRWYQDKDITAADRTIERPEYEQMLADIGVGMWGGIVVWRLDRLVRMLYEFERCHRIVEDANGFIASIEPNIDSRDEIGKMFMRLLVMFAEMEIATMKARAKGHRQQRAADGMYNGGGSRPFGFVGAIKEEADSGTRYLNIGKVGVEQIPEEIALMQEAAQRIAWEGWTWVDVVNDWNSRTPPVRGTTGALIHVHTLQNMLCGPRAIGKREVTIEDPETGEETTSLVKAVWEPVLDEKTWLRLNSLRKRVTPYGRKATYILTSILTCGRCENALSGAKRRYPIKGEKVPTRTYRCKSGVGAKAAGACGKLSVLAEPVEKLVIARVLKRIEETPELLKILVEKDSTADNELTSALKVIEDCDVRLDELAALFGRPGGLSTSEWMTARQGIETAKNTAIKTVERITKTIAVPVPFGNERENLLAWYEKLNTTQQHKLLSTFIKDARISPRGSAGRWFDPRRLTVTLASPEELRGEG